MGPCTRASRRCGERERARPAAGAPAPPWRAAARAGACNIAPVCVCVGKSVSARISKNRSTCTYARYSQGAAGCVSAL